MAKRKKERSPYRQSRLLQFFTVLFIVYIIINDISKGGGGFLTEHQNIPEVEKIDNISGDVEVNNNSIKNTQIPYSDIEAGSGVKAKCGDGVKIHLLAINTDDTILYDSKVINDNEPLSLKVGDIIDIDNLPTHLSFIRNIEGMKRNGVRAFIISKPESNEKIAYKIELIDILNNKESTDSLKLKIFDEYIGKGKVAKCGDKVTIKYSAYSPDGLIVSQEKKITFTIGLAEQALNDGISGMIEGGKRFLIIPPSEHNDKYIIQALDTNQIIHMEATLEKVE